MALQISRRLVELIQGAGPIKALLYEPKPLRPDDCPNCGGWGFHAIFAAAQGPLKTPTAPYSDKSSKYFEGAWWAGKTYTAPCPVCSGGEAPKQESLPELEAFDRDGDLQGNFPSRQKKRQ